MIEGMLQGIVYKKNGRITKLQLLTAEGTCELKASKYLHWAPHYKPAPNDVVQLKVLKKVKAGKVKLKAFEIVPIKAGERGRPKPQLPQPIELSLCQSSSCRKRGAEKLRAKLEKELGNTDNAPKVTVSKCLGKCKAGPVAQVRPSGMIYTKLELKKALDLLS